MPLVGVEEALEEMRQGRMVVVVDDVDRENEGDLIFAAEKATPEAVNFMARMGRGLICLALPARRLDELRIPLMTDRNNASQRTAFCVCIDARDGVSTGISAADRARTIQTAMDPAARADELVQPGHVPPLRAQDGGVLVRRGHSEAAVDLTRYAGMRPGGVICEVMNDDGTMARTPQLREFCLRHELKMLTIAELVRYRLQHEQHVRLQSRTTVATERGSFTAFTYESDVDGAERVVLTWGEAGNCSPVAIRVGLAVRGATESVEARALRLAADSSATRIEASGRGAVVFLAEPGPDESHAAEGNGAAARVSRPNSGEFEYEMGICAQILIDLGLHRIRLAAGDADQIAVLRAHGIDVTEELPWGPSEPAIRGTNGAASETRRRAKAASGDSAPTQ